VALGELAPTGFPLGYLASATGLALGELAPATALQIGEPVPATGLALLLLLSLPSHSGNF
jgi:hypothetical protein